MYICLLHNEPLAYDGMVLKTKACVKAMCGYSSTVHESKQTKSKPNPKEIIKYAVNEYRKAYEQLTRDGYPDKLADKLAKDVVLK